MIERVTLRAADVDASVRFYRTVLAPLGIELTQEGDSAVTWGDFAVAAATDSHRPTTGLHIGFVAPSHAEVDAFWQAGVDAGFRSDGEPGPRPHYRDDYYGAFLLDPDGNSAEAVWDGALRDNGNVDHLWIRVADLDASHDFYCDIAEVAGLTVGRDLRPERSHFRTDGGTFALVAGGVLTRNLELAFSAAGDAADRSLRDPDGNHLEIVDHRR